MVIFHAITIIKLVIFQILPYKIVKKTTIEKGHKNTINFDTTTKNVVFTPTSLLCNENWFDKLTNLARQYSHAIRIDGGLRADCVHNGKNERNFNRIEFISPIDFVVAFFVRVVVHW